MILSPKILLSLAAAAISLCPRGASAGHTAPRDNSTAPLRLNSDSYKTTPEDLADAHAKFTAYLSNHTGKLQAPDLPPPVLPSKITLSNATADEVARARKLVDEANEQQGRYNLWRIAHPRRDGADLGKGPNARNHQRQVETAHDKVRREVDEQGAPAPPVLDAALRAAAELVHRTDTQERYNNGTLQQYSNVGEDFPVPGRGGKLLRRGAATAGAGTWLEEQDHSLSQQPFHPDKDYKVRLYVNVFLHAHEIQTLNADLVAYISLTGVAQRQRLRRKGRRHHRRHQGYPKGHFRRPPLRQGLS